MKRRTEIPHNQESGFYIQYVEDGFLAHKEGKELLLRMGLPVNRVPFSTVLFLKRRRIMWKDREGSKATISFRLKHDQIECFGSYKGEQRVLRVIRDWDDNEDMEMISKLESEAIGNLCMMCIYGPADS